MDESGLSSAYFSYLAIDANDEEFTEEVRSVVERDNNDWIINKIDAELRENLEIMHELANDEMADDRENAKKTAEGISRKMGIFRYLVDTYLDNYNLGEELEQEPGKAKVVFARNKSGNVMFQKSLDEIKKFSDDKYSSALALVERIANGDTDFNSEKQRPLTSSNKLKGTYEMKDYQVRVFYMREKEYTVVIGACVKKDDNDIRYRDGLANLKKQSEPYRNAIRDGKLDMKKELESAQEYMASLQETLGRGLK